jgi:hypothetical protein
MPRVEFEPTIPVFKRAKTVHASDLPATVIGPFNLHYNIIRTTFVQGKIF